MKKGISLVLVLVLCLSLCAWGKSKSATECEKLINAIGEVSVNCKEARETAEKDCIISEMRCTGCGVDRVEVGIEYNNR